MNSKGSGVLASVIIPVKNGLPEFKGVVDSLWKQKTDFDFEVIIIDSGSKDGSLEIAQAAELEPNSPFRVVEIASSEFGHGKTRNFGAKISNGEFCAYLTHDAKPFDDLWLANIVKPLRDDPKVAGVFGLVELSDARKYVLDEGLRKFCHFYSDNSSCLRKSVWENIPYPDTNFAEDQIFAKKIIEAGYPKSYAYDSVVYHSHDFSIWQTFQRTYEETCAFQDLFGYKICESLGQAFRNWRFLTKRDLGIGVKNRWFVKHPITFFMRPIRNLSMCLGQYYGTKNPEFMKSRRSFFSKDQKLKNS